jgi:CRISPR-associated protein Cas6
VQIDVAFPVQGELLPADHAYLLYAALSRCVPKFHDEAAKVRFAPVTGPRAEKGTIRIVTWSRLRVRLPAEAIGLALPLAGQSLELGGHRVMLRAPTVSALVPAATLRAKVVTFKNATAPEQFLATCRWKLDQLGVAGEPGIPLTESGNRAGEPRRRVVRVKGRRIVGYALQVTGLTAEESLLLQEHGLGGRCRLGCGFFLPA